MQKTNNFLNNQRYIGSEKIKKIIYLNYKDNSSYGLSLHTGIIFTIFVTFIMYIGTIITILNFKMDSFFVLIIGLIGSVGLTFGLIDMINNRISIDKYNLMNYYLTPNILERLRKLKNGEFIPNQYYEITKK